MKYGSEPSHTEWKGERSLPQSHCTNEAHQLPMYESSGERKCNKKLQNLVLYFLLLLREEDEMRMLRKMKNASRQPVEALP